MDLADKYDEAIRVKIAYEEMPAQLEAKKATLLDGKGADELDPKLVAQVAELDTRISLIPALVQRQERVADEINDRICSRLLMIYNNLLNEIAKVHEPRWLDRMTAALVPAFDGDEAAARAYTERHLPDWPIHSHFYGARCGIADTPNQMREHGGAAAARNLKAIWDRFKESAAAK